MFLRGTIFSGNIGKGKTLVDWHPKNNLLLNCFPCTNLKVWEMNEQPKVIHSLPLKNVTEAKFCNSGIFVKSGEDYFHWNLSNKKYEKVKKFKVSQSESPCFYELRGPKIFSNNGKHIAYGENFVNVLYCLKRKNIVRLPISGKIVDLDWSYTDQYLAIAKENKVIIWDWNNQTKLCVIPEKAEQVKWSKCDNLLATTANSTTNIYGMM